MFNNYHSHSSITESIKQLPQMTLSWESHMECDTVCSGNKLQTLWWIQNIESRFIPAKRRQIYTKRYNFTSWKMEMFMISTVRTAKSNMHVVNQLWINIWLHGLLQFCRFTNAGHFYGISTGIILHVAYHWSFNQANFVVSKGKAVPLQAQRVLGS